VRAHVITMWEHELSNKGFKALNDSHAITKQRFPIKKFDAIISDVDRHMQNDNIKWNYPWDAIELDIASGLIKTPYPTKNRTARIACALSHYNLWKKCYKEDDPFLILEHDAIFTKQLNYKYILQSKYDIIGINDPRGATRRVREYSDAVERNPMAIQRPPIVDDMNVPQGIAGNSAYIIKPAGAKFMLDLVNRYGLWPNDAIMCQQLVPALAITKQYYTKVQGLNSTTSL
jgi:GR25 family glycosyltransferase involved in LPS biosynthesis